VHTHHRPSLSGKRSRNLEKEPQNSVDFLTILKHILKLLNASWYKSRNLGTELRVLQNYTEVQQSGILEHFSELRVKKILCSDKIT
jgi:hypothetical protein